MTISPAEIRQILEALEQSGWDEAVITIDDVTISLARNGAGGAPVATAPPPAATPVATAPPPVATAQLPAAPEPPVPTGSESGGSGVVVTAPTVGIFWRSPQPGAPPFVEVGTRVAPGQTLCIIEVMKLMNNVVTEVAGTVTALHVENGRPVEFGIPLVTIAPD